MDGKLYQQYLQQYVKEAIEHSDGSVRQIADRLHEQVVKGIFISHRVEKERALVDAQKAFDEHSHWPLGIILSHLGVALEEKP
jgi:hypothetical protein